MVIQVFRKSITLPNIRGIHTHALTKLHQLSIHIIYEALMVPDDSLNAGGWLQPPERSAASSPEKQSENVERRSATAAPHSDMTANDPAFWAAHETP